MPIANHDKVVETAEALLDEIRKTARKYTTPAHCRELADAFKAVVEASPKFAEGSSCWARKP